MLQCYDEGGPGRREPARNLRVGLSGEPRFLWFGRCHFLKDLANQIRYSVDYQKAAGGSDKGHLNVSAGEYLSGWLLTRVVRTFGIKMFWRGGAGLPLGWTSPRLSAVNMRIFRAMFPHATSKAKRYAMVVVRGG